MCIPREGETPPASRDWDVTANTVAGGSSAERVRGHLRPPSRSAWDAAQWLTHVTGAARDNAVFVLDAEHTVLVLSGHAVIHHLFNE
jgi:hypothetical protein